MGAARLVLLDLGGVVVRICRTWGEAAKLAGVAMRHDGMFQEESLAAERRGFRDRYETGRMTCAAYFEALSGHFGGLYAPREIEAVHRAWVIEEYAGVGALIERLHGRGVETGCLSNTNAAHWRGMLGIDPHRNWCAPTLGRLKHRLASHELGAAKPNEAIYMLAEERTGFKPAEIMFFDDLEANTEGARRRGWSAYLIDPSQETAPQIERALSAHGLL